MEPTSEKPTDLAGYLKRPYARIVTPERDGSFRAEIMEFPGCIALGDTASEALAQLEDVAESWLQSTLARGQEVPEPMEDAGYSGKFVLRLPKSLHKKAAYVARRENVSLNQLVVTCLAEHVGGVFERPTVAPQVVIYPRYISVSPAEIREGLTFDHFGRFSAGLPIDVSRMLEFSRGGR